MLQMSGPVCLWAVSLLEMSHLNGEKTDSALRSKDHPPPEVEGSEVYVPGNAPL